MRQILEDIRNKLSEEAYKNEEHIRLSLVIRILHKLGWNIWDPKEVYSEFPVVPHEDQTKVDLALILTPNSPSVFIEIKALGKLKGNIGKTERQLRDYNRNNTAMFSVMTDGQNWRFYYSQTGGEFTDKRFKTFDIIDDDMDDIELFLISFLSRSEISKGNAKADAESYLQASRKERLMESAYPKASRMTSVAPFPRLPQALVDLVSEENNPITLEEASRYLESREAKKPLSDPIITDTYRPEITSDVKPYLESMEIKLKQDNVKAKNITIPREYRDLFPPRTPSRKHEKKRFTVYDSDGKEYTTHIEGGYRLPGITEFFHKNKQLKEGDKIYIDIITPKERYRLRTK